MAECYASVSTDRYGRVELVGLAAEGEELVPGSRPVRRLGEPPLAERQRLVAPNYQRPVRHRGDGSGLLARERQRDLAGASLDPLLDRALVEMRGPRLDR